MKKKRFFKNAKRNQIWTEEEKGRKIDFADKYVYNDTYSDKYDYLRPKASKKKYFNKHRVQKFFKRLAAVVISFAVICVGYTLMDVYMQRHAMPENNPNSNAVSEPPINEIALDLKSEYVNSVSLDGGIMLDSVITDISANGYDSAAIDIKRREGTIGYRSALANVDTFGAVAFPASDLKGSVKKLQSEDILAVGILSCYLDNLVPAVQKDMAIVNSNGILYRDSRDNTYLNPNSDATYNYIKGIIQEAYETGITVFVLDGVDLPNDIKDNYNDGFDALSARLYKDLGTDIKLIRPVYVSLATPAEEDGIADEIKEKLDKTLENDKIYFINTQSDKTLIKQKLEEQGVYNYILAN